MSHTDFSGMTWFVVADRDGYEENVFPITVRLRFSDDGALSAWESRGLAEAGDSRMAGAPNFDGTWTRDEDLVRFSLKRARPPEQVPLEIPDGREAGDYYFYPESGEATCLDEGEYVAALSGATLHLLDQPRSQDATLVSLTAVGEPEADFPRLDAEVEIRKSREWVTFEWDPDEVDVQLQSDDEPTATKRYLVLRFYSAQSESPERRVEAWEKSARVPHDFFSMEHPQLRGVWTHEYPQGFVFDLARLERDTDGTWLEGRYQAAYYDGELRLQHFPGESDRSGDLATHRRSMRPISPGTVWMSSVSKDPYPAWEEAWRSEPSSHVTDQGETSRSRGCASQVGILVFLAMAVGGVLSVT